MATAKKGARKGGAKKGAKKAAKKSMKKSTKKAAAKRAPARKAAKKAPAKKATKKRAPNPAFMRPMKPSSELAAVIGNNPMPRSEVAKRLWQYIKKNNLQDAKERRMINADDKLRSVFGGRKQVSMFEMTKLVNKHLSA